VTVHEETRGDAALLQLATVDPDRIRAWWDRAPYNIGVACGPSRLVVIDLDVPHAGRLDGPAAGSGAGEGALVAGARPGTRNDTLNRAAFSLGQLGERGCFRRSTSLPLLPEQRHAAVFRKMRQSVRSAQG
jgi:hypothetical protein